MHEFNDAKFISIVRMKYLVNCLTFFVLMITISGCGKDDPEKIAENDRKKILNYLADNDLEAIEHESGIFYNISREGVGAYPAITSTVRITYTGYIVGGKKDGTIFDAGMSMTIDLRSTIRGWQIGVPLFNRGSNGLLIIPSGLAYGENLWGSRNIPPHSILLFNIELEDFN